MCCCAAHAACVGRLSRAKAEEVNVSFSVILLSHYQTQGSCVSLSDVQSRLHLQTKPEEDTKTTPWH